MGAFRERKLRRSRLEGSTLAVGFNNIILHRLAWQLPGSSRIVMQPDLDPLRTILESFGMFQLDCVTTLCTSSSS